MRYASRLGAARVPPAVSVISSVSPLAALLILAAASCSKSSADKPNPAASTSAAASAVAAASAAPSSSAGKASTGATAWSGSYLAKVGPVAPPENAKEKTWTDDPGTAAVGRGAIALSIGGSRGDTQGEITGPLGDLKVAGVFDGTELRANVLPKDPKSDAAMTGFMLLAASGETPPASLKGTLRVSNRDAKIVREASVELAKK